MGYFVYSNYCDVTEDLVMELLRTARLFNLPRLEDKCTEFLADNIEAMADDTDLHKIIRQDANEVKDRQETDSIQVIDDIRSHIRSRVRTMSEMSEAEMKMSVVDNLLSELDME